MVDYIKSLVVLISIHHDNILKIADAKAKVIKAKIKKPSQIKLEEIQEYDIIGFGSEIYDYITHNDPLNLADKLPLASNKKAFIFSTGGLSSKVKATNDHLILREKLQSNGHTIINEFQRKSFKTNNFLKYFGGINKNRPNAEDLKHVEEFTQNIIKM